LEARILALEDVIKGLPKFLEGEQMRENTMQQGVLGALHRIQGVEDQVSQVKEFCGQLDQKIVEETMARQNLNQSHEHFCQEVFASSGHTLQNIADLQAQIAILQMPVGGQGTMDFEVPSMEMPLPPTTSSKAEASLPDSLGGVRHQHPVPFVVPPVSPVLWNPPSVPLGVTKERKIRFTGASAGKESEIRKIMMVKGEEPTKTPTSAPSPQAHFPSPFPA
jgi:hypothetical protein